MVAALLNHLDAIAPEAYTLDQMRDRMYEWPTVPPRQELFFAAFQQLEDEGMVKRIEAGGKSGWRRTKN